MKQLAVLFSGTGTNLAYILKNLHQKGQFRVVVALCNNPNAKGIEIAKDYGIKVEIVNHKEYATREAFDTKVVEIIQSYHPELTILAGFMRIVTPIFTNAIRAINLHPSLLPKYKGLHAIERSYESGDEVAGVSVHWVSSELDGGEVILQKSFERLHNMSFEAFETKIKTIEKEALVEAIEKVLT
ncbi:MAG: phosphoribosylglycinamide formyltransferase [Campylobacterales bacterium]|nr:phosphoribosylglycinamide formyltransferase [Campylobacterales bacterium]